SGEQSDKNPVYSEAMTYVNDAERLLFASMVLRKLLLSYYRYTRLRENDIRERKLMLPLETASECGLLDLVEFLLSHVRGLETALNNSLICAAAEGHINVAKLLVDRG